MRLGGSAQLDGSRPIPDHDLLERIGRGGYGEVWLARNRTTSTLRAVKMVFRHEFEDERPYQREFEVLLKFEPISRSHPSQLAILHVGRNEDAGCFYYLMELADEAIVGQTSSLSGPEGGTTPAAGVETGKMPAQRYFPRTLRSELKSRNRLPAAEVIELGRALATALAHLHSHGLVHRDIKPANIVYVGGVPKLADIGLVTEASDNCSIVGTEGYIPPEGPGSPQADLYSLGKVLYEAATGKDRRDYPALPEDLRNWPDSSLIIELNAILLGACAADCRERYQSADQMRADLELLHVGQSIKRRRARQRTWGLVRKAALALGTLAVVSGIGYWFSTWRLHAFNSPRSGQLNFGFSTNNEAQEEYGKGMRALHGGHTSQNSMQAIQHLQRAVELDPKFAEAWAELAGAWNSAAGSANQQTNVLRAAEKAVSLNPNSALANSMLASAKFQELEWARGEEARLRSVALAPDNEEILLRSALNLACTGRPKEALADLERARRADPTSASNFRTICSGYALAWCGEYDRAIKIFNEFPDATFWMKEQHALAYLG